LISIKIGDASGKLFETDAARKVTETLAVRIIRNGCDEAADGGDFMTG
jgi:hypothetical protein